MTNADRECNSPDAIWCREDHPILFTNGSKTARNRAQAVFAAAFYALGTHEGALAVWGGLIR